ncbi:MAG: peptidase M24 [Gammaproteobacteria bacterium]|nr:MAG: peptidase M24 [Gammaproteobacteria bacterium]
MVITSITFFLLLLILFPAENASASRQHAQPSAFNQLEIGKRYPLAIDVSIANVTNGNNQTKDLTSSKFSESNFNQKNELSWKKAKVRKGDSLAKILNRLGFNARVTYEVSSAQGKNTQLLKKIMVGDTLRIGSNPRGKLISLVYPLSQTKTLFVNYLNNNYQSHIETKTVETRTAYVQGKITSNFWNAGIAAGMDDGQIINLANVFGWDIDFALDLRKDDTFNVVYEDRYVDGDFIGHGKILAAEFVNQGEVFQAIRFSDNNYYTPAGKSMRKAFLRAPVNFRYISSNFKKRRFHPIQKRWKAHNGTDYRAKTGTPVVAAGNGRIIKATYNKFNGNYVFIQHGDGVLTKYLHFSKRAVKKGQRVKQGQVIGYVGMTGLAEAPHLHYEFLVNGVHRNPRTVKLPDARPIAKKYRIAFKLLASKRLKELEGSKRTLLAMLK